MINPFHYQGALNFADHPAVMINRSELTGEIIKGIHSRRWYAITGPRKVGKTTLLLQVYSEFKRQEATKGIKFIRMQHLCLDSVQQFYSDLLQEIISPDTKLDFIPTTTSDDRKFLAGLRRSVKELKENNLLVLIFDGMEHLPLALLDRFMRVLALLFEDRNIDPELNRLGIIICGSVDLEAKNSLYNPIPGLVSIVRLYDLPYSDIERWMNRVSGQMDFPVENGVVRLLYEYTSGMIYLIQKICGKTLQCSPHTFELSCKQVQQTINDIESQGEGTLLEPLREIEKDIELSRRLGQILDYKVVQKPHHDIHWNRLFYFGLLAEHNKTLKIRNPIYVTILSNAFSHERQAEIFYRFKEYDSSKQCYEQAMRKTKATESVLALLKEYIAGIATHTDPQSVYQAVIDAVKQIFFPVPACNISLIDKENQALKIVAFDGLNPDNVAEYSHKVGEGLSGWVAKVGAGRIHTDVHSESIGEELSILSPGIRNDIHAMSCTPLKVMGQVIGVLNIYWPDQRIPFYHPSILSIFASHTAIAIQNVHYYEDVQKTHLDLETITNLSRKVSKLTGLDFIFDHIVSTASNIAHSPNIFLAYRPIGQQTWAFKFPDGYNTELGLTDPESLTSIPGLAMQKKQVISVRHSISKKDLAPSWPGVNLELGIPLIAMGQVWGVLVVGLVGDLDLSSQQQAWLHMLAEQAAMAMHNMFLLDLAEERTRQVITLKEIGEALGRDMSLQEILVMISRAALNVVGQGNKASFVLLKDDTKKMMEIKAAAGEAFAKDFLGFKIRMNEKSLVTWVARKAKVRYVPDVEGEEDYLELYPRIKSELAVPLIFRTELIGVIDIESTQANAFSDQDIQLLQVLADSAAVAAKVGELCDIRLKHLQALNTAGLEISSTLELDKVLETIIREALNAIGPKNRFIYLQLLDESGQFLKLHVIKGVDCPTEFVDTTIDIQTGMSGWAVREKRHYLCNNVNEDPNYLAMKAKVGSALCVPILFHDEIIGVLNVESFTENDFGARELEILQGLASQAGAAIENARLSQNLVDAQFNLTQALEVSVIGETLAGISHDIRTSSSLITGEIHWLLRKKRRSELDMSLVMESLDKMQGYVNRIEKMTSDLARRSQQTPPHLESTTVIDLVKESTWFVVGQARRRHVIFKIDHESLQFSLHLDRNRMKRVFLNLIMNAFDSMADGGELIIKGEREDSYRLIIIQDSGIGIDPEFIDSVWKPFSSTKKTGSGLGLSICKRIVENDHGGRITLTSKPGVGTTIVMKFKDESKNVVIS